MLAVHIVFMQKVVVQAVGWLKQASLEKLQLIVIRVAAGSIPPLHLLTHSNMMKIVVSKRKARTMTEILRNSIIHISPNNIL